MTTEVSINPRDGRGSATRRGILIDHRVKILPKARAGNARGSREGGEYGVGRYEHSLTERVQLANGDAIPGDDECSTPVEIAHDSPAVVAKLALGYSSSHSRIVARALRRQVLSPNRARKARPKAET
jgi:hypothetical protein